MYQTHGLTVTVRTDNGPLFSSAQFEGFLEHLGIAQKNGIPHWLQSKGKVESTKDYTNYQLRGERLEKSNARYQHPTLQQDYPLLNFWWVGNLMTNFQE